MILSLRQRAQISREQVTTPFSREYLVRCWGCFSKDVGGRKWVNRRESEDRKGSKLIPSLSQ